MKLLNIEVNSRGEVFFGRYDIFRENGAEIYHLTSKNNPSTYPMFAEVRYFSEQTLEEVIKAAKLWHKQIVFDAVITTDEASVISTAAISQELELPGLSVEAAQKSRNKFYMRLAHQKYLAPHPHFQCCDTLDQAVSAASLIGYPVILKPTLGGNAEHTYLIHDEKKLRDIFPKAWEANQRYSYCQHDAQTILLGPNSMLIEEFLSGSEHCVEAWVKNGVAHIGSIADRISIELDTFDNDLYRTPSLLSSSKIALLQEALQAGVTAQGITHGVVHAEFRFHHDKPYIVEIAARVGGGSLYKMAQLSYGYCPIKTAYCVATNTYVQEKPLSKTGKVAVGLTMLCQQGIIKRIHIPEFVKSHPNVFNLGILVKEGDFHRRPPEGNDIFGYLGVVGDSQEQAIELAESLFASITIELE